MRRLLPAFRNYSKLTDLIGKDGIDSIRDFHEGVETGKYFSDMEFDLKDPDPSAKHILECLGSLDKPVQKAMDNFARVTTFRNLAEKNLLREATLFTSGMLEEKNGRLIVPQGYRPGMSSEEYQAWHPSARGNTAISVDTRERDIDSLDICFFPNTINDISLCIENVILDGHMLTGIHGRSFQSKICSVLIFNDSDYRARN